jgi:hypothetical protein
MDMAKIRHALPPAKNDTLRSGVVGDDAACGNPNFRIQEHPDLPRRAAHCVAVDDSRRSTGGGISGRLHQESVSESQRIGWRSWNIPYPIVGLTPEEFAKL